MDCSKRTKGEIYNDAFWGLALSEAFANWQEVKAEMERLGYRNLDIPFSHPTFPPQVDKACRGEFRDLSRAIQEKNRRIRQGQIRHAHLRGQGIRDTVTGYRTKVAETGC